MPSRPVPRSSKHVCPVCLYPGLAEPARSPKSGGGSFEICPCCGFQHGVDDDDRGLTYLQARNTWVKTGAKWSSQSIPPPQGWAAKAQLLSGPELPAVAAKSPRARLSARSPAKSRRPPQA